jgi:O-antigen/teichoic acid export membrane protein
MKEAKVSIKTGFFWLGIASSVSQIVDVTSSIVVLWFLSSHEMGVATLAWSIAVILESFNGLGIGTALVQSHDLKENQLSSIFWYSSFVSVFLFALISIVSPFIASYYNSPELTFLVILSGSKLLFVGIALVPLQLLNKKLMFREVSIVLLSANLLSALIKISFAMMGYGAFALVLSHMSYGVFVLLGAFLCYPYKPKMYFNFSEIRCLVIFGVKVTASGAIYHFYRNVDYLIVGKFFGKEALGIYRVAFDIAMTPALAILSVVNRATFPVLAKLKSDPKSLTETFLWMQEKIALFTLPIAVFLIFVSPDIVQLVGQQKWIAAAPVIQVLSVAAFFRCIAQSFPQLFHACNRPELAILDSGVSLALLVFSFSISIYFFSQSLGIVSIAFAWVVSYPLLIYFLLLFTRKIIPISFNGYIASFNHSRNILVISSLVSLIIYLLRYFLLTSSWSHLVAQSIFFSLTLMVYIRMNFDGSIKTVMGSKNVR